MTQWLLEHAVSRTDLMPFAAVNQTQWFVLSFQVTRIAALSGST